MQKPIATLRQTSTNDSSRVCFMGLIHSSGSRLIGSWPEYLQPEIATGARDGSCCHSPDHLDGGFHAEDLTELPVQCDHGDASIDTGAVYPQSLCRFVLRPLGDDRLNGFPLRVANLDLIERRNQMATRRFPDFLHRLEKRMKSNYSLRWTRPKVPIIRSQNFFPA